MNEPPITINGTTLTQGQAMTLRVALTTFLMEMSEDDALGADESGKALARAYEDSGWSVLRLIQEGRDK